MSVVSNNIIAGYRNNIVANRTEEAQSYTYNSKNFKEIEKNYIIPLQSQLTLWIQEKSISLDQFQEIKTNIQNLSKNLHTKYHSLIKKEMNKIAATQRKNSSETLEIIQKLQLNLQFFQTKIKAEDPTSELIYDISNMINFLKENIEKSNEQDE